MKRTHLIIYLVLFVALLHVACDKTGTSDSNASGGGGAGGSLARFTIVGNYLYVVDWSTLNVVDITDPTKPVKKGMVQVGVAIETIYPYKDKLFLGGQFGMYVYSLADPLVPKKEGSVTHVRACDPVVSNDTVSYVTLRSFGTSCGNVRNVLNVYDVKNPKDPKLVTTVDMKAPFGLGINNKSLYVCDGPYGMVTYDLANPYSPAYKKTITGEYFMDVIPYGNVLIAYIQGGVCFYDITNPMDPVLLSKVKG